MTRIFIVGCFTMLVIIHCRADLQPQCKAYLQKKNFPTPSALEEAIQGTNALCKDAGYNQYHPDPKPTVPGAVDTTDLGCMYVDPGLNNAQCCGWRPHFNWVIASCKNDKNAHFCSDVPACARAGSPKINYVATYQFNGTNFVLMDDSSAGELSAEGIAGSYSNTTGWERVKEAWTWSAGDWSPKYAPYDRDGNGEGPRGVTPPAGMWVLSADNFYYGAFYLLSQLGLNLEGHHNPTGTNCWQWETDIIEGTTGWMPGGPIPGNLNQLYSTSNPRIISSCMPIQWGANQAQGGKQEFSQPAQFKAYCTANPDAAGCSPWTPGQDVHWNGGHDGTNRFENLWDEPYVFAVVVDRMGYWIYRWRPEKDSGKTGWSGISRFHADRVLDSRPNPVKDPRGLKSDVPGDVAEAVILLPSVPPEAACLQAGPQAVDWNWGAIGLGGVAQELHDGGHGDELKGAHNWWQSFVDTSQNANYPLSIAGVPPTTQPYTCNKVSDFSCACNAEGVVLAASDRNSSSARPNIHM